MSQIAIRFKAICLFLISACINNAGGKFAYLDISKGLSNNDITSIYQDNRGLMWIGTYDGLNRYDGYNFIIYRNRASHKFSSIY